MSSQSIIKGLIVFLKDKDICEISTRKIKIELECELKFSKKERVI